MRHCHHLLPCILLGTTVAIACDFSRPEDPAAPFPTPDSQSQFGGTGGIGSTRKGPLGPQPSFGGTVVRSDRPVRPIAGGTLLVLHDGLTAVAVDPDRDMLYVANLNDTTVRFRVKLSPDDQPGRAVEDAAGVVHLVLRGAGAVADVDPAAGLVIDRRSVCPAPRGIAFDARQNQLHVACATGELVSLPAGGGQPTRSLLLDLDLRDVVMQGDDLLVSRFRSAEILTVNRAGAVTGRVTPPGSAALARDGNFAPAVAWRLLALPGGGAVMVHQRGLDGEVQVGEQGGYGDACESIVESVVTEVRPGSPLTPSVGLPRAVLPVDIAASAMGTHVAIVSPANARVPSAPGVFVARLSTVLVRGPAARPVSTASSTSRDASVKTGSAGSFGGGGVFSCNGGFEPEGAGGTSGSGGTGGTRGTGGAGGSGGRPSSDAGVSGNGGADGGGSPDAGSPDADESMGDDVVEDILEDSFPVPEEAIAVAFFGKGRVVVQTRDPATLLLLPTATVNRRGDVLKYARKIITLSSDRIADTGHAIFHANAGGLIACASCHPEGGEDGRVWTFSGTGRRRTQSLRGGISDTAPFHWDGDMRDMTQITTEVFMRRMSGPSLTDKQAGALTGWVDTIPFLPASSAAGAPAVERGRALFNSSSAGCAACHAGPKMTNNAAADIGTGGMFQTPSLVGVRWRAPFMHTGCAPTLRDRFGSCGGGAAHGNTKGLTPAQIGDLSAYLESL